MRETACPIQVPQRKPARIGGVPGAYPTNAERTNAERMNAWLYENPLPLALALAAIAAFLAWRSITGGRRAELAAAGIAALLGIGAIVAGRLVVTPGEHAREVVEELVALAEDAEVLRAGELFAPNAVLNYGRRENSGFAIEAIRSAIGSLANANRIESNRVTRLVARTLDESTGEVELSCTTTTARAMGPIPTNWVVRVRRSGDAWKIDRLTFESVFGQMPTPRMW
jgi:hypothetical protein